MDQLNKKDIKNIPYFCFNNITKECYVIKVYDADTITVVMELPMNLFQSSQEQSQNPEWNTNQSPREDENICKLFKLKLRLDGLDTPEIKCKSDKEKKYAIKARDWLRECILNKYISVDLFKFDKYGRTLCKIYDKERKICYNDLILDNGIGISYKGGKKQLFDEWFNEDKFNKFINKKKL